MVAGADLLDLDFFWLFVSAGRARLVVLSLELFSVFFLVSFLSLSFSVLFSSSAVLGITTCISVRFGLLAVTLMALNVLLNFRFVVLCWSGNSVSSSLVIVVVLVWAMEGVSLFCVWLLALVFLIDVGGVLDGGGF